jgi:lysophospholipase L1-like esterase
METTVRFEQEEADPAILSASEEDALLRGAPWRRLALLGDSIVEGMGDHTPGYAPQYWPDRLAGALGRQQPGFACLNLGRRDLRAGEVRSTQLGPALAFGPDLAMMVCGGNDLLVEHFDVDAVEREIDVITSALVGAGVTVISSTMLDMPKAIELPAPIPERLAELHERLRAVAARHETLLVDFALEVDCSEPGLYSTDLKHASTRGHAVVASHVIRRLGQLLGNAPAGGNGRPG